MSGRQGELGDFVSVARERADLNRRLYEALKHLPRERQIQILTSWLSLDSLRDMVKFQENR